MNIPEIVEILTSSGIEKHEAVKEVKMLIEHYCNYHEKDIIMGRPLDYGKLEIVKQKAFERVNTGLPIQYIIGKAYFMGDMYNLSPDVLIPRGDTEFVVMRAISLINENKLKKVLDIGCGSGCIACSIAKNTFADVVSVDISQKALDLAKTNVEELKLSNVDLVCSDLFKQVEEQSFDLIISNPPYIPRGTILQDEVMKEPDLALFADGDGTDFYRRIVSRSCEYLTDCGYVVFELGINQSNIVKKYLEDAGFVDVLIEKDLAGIDRVISAHL
jgi:release factor glutamine methyltransferase